MQAPPAGRGRSDTESVGTGSDRGAFGAQPAHINHVVDDLATWLAAVVEGTV